MEELKATSINSLIEGYAKKVEKNEKTKVDKQIEGELLNFIEDKAVLGFDIYRYSQYPLLQQTIIPHIFKLMYDKTIDNVLSMESFLFQGISKKTFYDRFIDTGDGGFMIFDSPVNAIVFSLYFQANIQRYNSGFFKEWNDYHQLVGEITLRYSLTYDSIYSYNNNFYGRAIINNARIMAKDKLNRFLIDENTVKWYRKNINGIENIKVLEGIDFEKIWFFENYESKNKSSYIFPFDQEMGNKILSTDLLKIGEVTSKMDVVSVYSLYIQAYLQSCGKDFGKLTISLGNLNSTGIVD